MASAALNQQQSATSSTNDTAAARGSNSEQQSKDKPSQSSSQQQHEATTTSASSGGKKASPQRRHSQVQYSSPLTYEEVASLAKTCTTEEKVVWVAKQILGVGGANGFQKATSTMQRMKRQRARSFKQKDTTEKGESSTAEDAEATFRKEEERLKLDTFNVRVAKRMQTEMKQGLQFCNLMTDVIRSILEDIDPENPMLLVQPPMIGSEASFASMPSSVLPPLLPMGGVVADATMSAMTMEGAAAAGTMPGIPSGGMGATDNNFPTSATSRPRLDVTIKGKSSSSSSIMKVPESPGAARKAALANSDNPEAETVAEGNPNGSTLRKLRKRGSIPSAASTTASDVELLKLVGDHDESGKKLSKKEIAYRLFEATRFRTLEVGDYVAAKMASHDLWILARVAKRWNSVIGTSYKQMAGGMTDKSKRDALFKEKVFIQDNDEYNGDSQSESARAVSRQHVLPLPRSFGEASDWAGMRIRKGSRVYAMYPNTTALYCGSVVDSTTYCRIQDDIIVVQFDGDEDDDKDIIPQRHIPARFVTLIPREFPSSQKQKRRKSSTVTTMASSDGGGARKRERSTTTSNVSLLPTGTSSSAPPPPAATPIQGTALGDEMFLAMYGGGGGSSAAPSGGVLQKRNYDDVFSSTPHSSTTPKLPAARHEPPLKLPPKRKSSQMKRSKKQKRGDANNPNLASSHF